MNVNPSEERLEEALRRAPQPTPPPGLRRQLIEQIELSAPARLPALASAPAEFPWFRRWRWALAMGGVAAVSLGALAFQQSRIEELQSTLQELQRQLEQAPPTPDAPSAPAESGPVENGAAELERLRSVVNELTQDVQSLEGLAAENARLKAQTAATVASPEEISYLSEARDRARRIACVNNLKQIGLAARIWATDNGDLMPPDFLSMSNELSTPKILVCPADSAKTAATSWGEFSAAQCSYEYLAPSVSAEDPTRVAFRCTVHHNYCLLDGSVQQLSEEQAANLVHRNGGVYLGVPVNAVRQSQMNDAMRQRYGLGPSPDASAPAPTVQMSEELQRRYGLLPADDPGPFNVAQPPEGELSEVEREVQPEPHPAP